MRTTISIDEHLLAQARVFAAQRRRSLSALIEDALREVMAARRAAAKRKKTVLPVVHGHRVRGVEYGSFASLMELTDGR